MLPGKKEKPVELTESQTDKLLELLQNTSCVPSWQTDLPYAGYEQMFRITLLTDAGEVRILAAPETGCLYTETETGLIYTIVGYGNFYKALGTSDNHGKAGNRKMKVLIVGLGSMGKRRGRILRSVKPDAELCGVDLTESRRKEAEDLGIRAYDSISGRWPRNIRTVPLCAPLPSLMQKSLTSCWMRACRCSPS